MARTQKPGAWCYDIGRTAAYVECSLRQALGELQAGRIEKGRMHVSKALDHVERLSRQAHDKASAVLLEDAAQLFLNLKGKGVEAWRGAEKVERLVADVERIAKRSKKSCGR